MRLLFFNFCFLLVVFTNFSQNKSVFKKSFNVTNQTNLVLDLENVGIVIEKSEDNTVDFDYSIEFENFSKRKIKNNLSKILVSAISLGNDIKLKAENKSQFGGNTSKHLYLDGSVNIINKFKTSKLKDTIIHKSKDSLINEIKDRGMKTLQNWLNDLDVVDGDGKKNSAIKYKVKTTKSTFLIKIPNNLNLRINAKNSMITVNKNITTIINGKISGGFIKAKEISNPKNMLSINNSLFEVEKLNGGVFSFKNLHKVLIGESKNTKITSNGSKIEIGEINQNVSIKDFNSEVKLYNFSNSFKEFNFTGEYSKIYFFEPKTNYELSCIGHDATFYFNKNNIISQPSKTSKKSKMLEKERKKKKPFSGTIKFDIVHTHFYYPTTVNINKN